MSKRLRKSAIVSIVLSVVLTIVALVFRGDFTLLIDVQLYFLLGLAAVLLVAYLNTRRELSTPTGRDRLCLQFVNVLTSCIVCLGLLLTLIALVKTLFCVAHFRFDIGYIAVSLLPFLYCLTIAEVACPALAHHFGCRIERAEQGGQRSDRDPSG